MSRLETALWDLRGKFGWQARRETAGGGNGFIAFKSRVGRRLEGRRIGHFGKPCPYWRPDQTTEVRAALSINVAGLQPVHQAADV